MVEFAVLLVCSLFIGGGSTIVLVVVGYTHPKSGWQIASLEGTYSAAIQDARLCKEVSGDVARLSALSSLLVIFCAKANHGVVTFLTDGFKQKLEETILIFDPGYGTLIVGSPMGSRILPMKCLQLHNLNHRKNHIHHLQKTYTTLHQMTKITHLPRIRH